MFLVHNVKMHTNFYSRNKETTKSIKEYKRDSPFSYCCIPAIVLQSGCKWKKNIVLNIAHRIIWKSVSIQKRSQRKVISKDN